MAETTTGSQIGWDLVKIGFGLVSGAAIPLVVEWLKQRLYGPRLEVMHGEGESFVPRSEEPGKTPGPHPSRYLRVRVKNTGRMIAKNCRAYLVNIEELVHGNPSRTFYRDTLRLRWAYEEQEELHEGVDIPPGVFIYFDIMSTKCEDNMSKTLLQVAKLRHHFVNKLEFNKVYRFTVLVAADATDPVQICLTVVMGKTWENFSVTGLEPRMIKGQKPSREAR